MSIKILFIAPYNGLKELVNTMKDDFPDLDIDVLVGDLEEGVRYAKETYQQYDLIISRGGTARYIKKSVPIPVIEVKVSGYDVLKVLTLADGYPGKSAIVGFSNVAQGARTIASLLDMDIKTVEIDSGTEVHATLTDLQEAGITSIIGDTITVETAKKIGLHGILITSGTEAVHDSFEEAIQIYELANGMQKEIQRYKELLRNEQNAYILLDANGNIAEQNHAADQFIRKMGTAFRQIRNAALACMDTNTKNRKMVTTNESTFDILFLPFKEGLCWIKITDTPIRTDGNQGIYIEEVTAGMDRIGSSKEIQTVHKKIQAASDHSLPVLLIGENGVGKSTAAKEIHRRSSHSHHPFATVVCDEIPAGSWKTTIHSVLTNEHFGTCYLINLENVSNDRIHALADTLKERVTGPRLIAGMEQEKYRFMFQDDDTFQSVFSRAMIEIPPLRERKEDIESWAHYLISYFNTEHGRQIVGFREGASALLREFEWPGNIRQLTTAIKQLVAEADGFYIETASVETLLQAISAETHTDTPLSLTGTLEEIEKKVIKAVLKEENYNKSKTAARLGINRSTLWRKLQS
ncbi:PrpR N-terminal domain-containing protein [Terribacillus halophilus]|uniref:sigma-54-dependent Fis family transcriptional regulator n=1 Tax=Terribacillus halophilus TaxID=361279 RepID=UPI003981B29D